MSAKHAASSSQNTASYRGYRGSGYSGGSNGYRGSSNRTVRQPREKHTARTVALVILAVVVIVALCGVSLVASARAALGDAATLQNDMSVFRTQMSNGDSDSMEETVQSMSSAASDLNSQMSNPLWRVATIVPVYGSDVSKVIDLASVSNDLVNGALVPITQKSGSFSLSGFIKKDGSINLKKLEPTVQALAEANAAIQRSNNTMSSMGTSNISQLNSAIDTLKGVLPELATASNACSQLSPVVDDMLGGDGERTYLLVAMNNVEMRSVGGFPGSMGPITIKNGTVTLGEFKSVYDWIPHQTKSNAVSITDEEANIFSQSIAYRTSRVAQVPDFSRVGSIWNAQWDKHHSDGIDGIIAMDPVFLQNLLKLTGGFTASNGWKINGNNAAETLMNRSYIEMDISETDAFFSEVAGRAFEKVKDNLGKIDVADLVDVVNDGVTNRRLNVWMKNSKEEAALQQLGYTGELSTDITNPTLGVYLSDYAYAKYAWYLDEDMTISNETKNADGSKSYEVTVSLKNTLTSSERQRIEEGGDDTIAYVFGNHTSAKRDTTDMVYFLYLVAPAGGSITDVETTGNFGSYSKINRSKTLDGKKNDNTMAQTSYNGHQMWGGAARIEPGEETTVTFKVTTAAGVAGDLQVDRTPSANPNLDWKIENDN